MGVEGKGGNTGIKEAAFAQAVSIPDYYPACEHLHSFSSRLLTDREKKQWAEEQKALMNGQWAQVIHLAKYGKAIAAA